MAAPIMLVVAGPSGSGKSRLYPVAAYGYASFNVDDRCRDLHGTYVSVPPSVRAQAQQECEAFVTSQIAARSSLAVETTLRTDIAIRQAAEAKKAGFLTQMIYVATDDVEVNVERVARRGLRGGHSAAPERIREIYASSLANLVVALAIFDNVLLFDNSSDGADAVFVCEFRAGRMMPAATDLPSWLRAALAG